jgi:hypothetical protein
MFIHLTDQYVGTTANNRYPPSTPATATVPLFVSNVVGQNDILAIVHTAAKALGTGYGHVYHVFLPKGVPCRPPAPDQQHPPSRASKISFLHLKTINSQPHFARSRG